VSYPSRVWDLAREYGLKHGFSAREVLDQLEISYREVMGPSHVEVPTGHAIDTLKAIVRINPERGRS